MLYYLLLLSGAFSIIMALITSAYNNLSSKVMFKLLPFFFGLLQLFIAAKNLGWQMRILRR